jgi:hypothetical protein
MEQPAGYKIAVFTSSPATFIETHFSLASKKVVLYQKASNILRKEKPKVC